MRPTFFYFPEEGFCMGLIWTLRNLGYAWPKFWGVRPTPLTCIPVFQDMLRWKTPVLQYRAEIWWKYILFYFPLKRIRKHRKFGKVQNQHESSSLVGMSTPYNNSMIRFGSLAQILLTILPNMFYYYHKANTKYILFYWYFYMKTLNS